MFRWVNRWINELGGGGWIGEWLDGGWMIWRADGWVNIYYGKL